ncbi:hypothetical protein G6F35_017673 [Rhizopus arrhizus]|nr:hypothetical protein G6F23_012349 [Rhizopus arrhizus]KAG1167623.1 hypothetical protein G6F35_017673 [Rhizopus arrhizus]
MRQQLADGDGGGSRWQFGQPLAGGLVQPEPAVLHQQQHRRGGELLADRGQPEVAGRGDRGAVFHHRQPVAATEYRLPVMQDQHRGAGHLAVIGLHQAVDTRIRWGQHRGGGAGWG